LPLAAAGEPSKSGQGQHLPWNRLANLEEYLAKQGIMEGVILANGDKADFDVCAKHTERSNPVVAMKSTGGAADVMAQAFERRIGGQAEPYDHPALEGHKVPKIYQDMVRHRAKFTGICGGMPYPDAALCGLDPKVVHFNQTADLDDSELMLIDAVDPEAGQLLQRNMADMLTKGGDGSEAKLGFAPSERARIETAWDDSISYDTFSPDTQDK
jgi:hypothetical protein